MRKGELLRAEVVGDLWVLPDTKNGEPHIVPINPKVRSAALVPRPSYSKLTYWWCKARSLTGVKMRFHDWRHSTGSEIINNGGTLKDVQGALNQKSAASANRYSHLLIETKRAALQKVGQKRRAA
jgi:integrase